MINRLSRLDEVIRSPRSSPLLLIVTLLSGEGPTGVETHFSVLAGAAAARGFQCLTVTPYSISRWARGLFRPLKHRKSERARVLYRWGQAILLRMQVKELMRIFPNREVTLYPQCPLSTWACLSARGDREVRIVSVIHYNGSEAEEVVATGAAKSDGPLARHFDKLERVLLPRVDGLAFVSAYMQRIVNRRLPEITSAVQRTLVNFPAVAKFSVNEVLPKGDLIAIGTLEPRKNQEFLLRVLQSTRDLGQRYRLTIVGAGPDRPRLEKLASEWNLSEQVVFLGFQPNAGRYLSSHRVLVHAAKLENCPLIIAEALSFGRPVFAAAVGGIPELFDDAVEGFYWDLNDPVEAGKKVVRLLENESLYAEMAAASRERYERVFTDVPDRWLGFLFPTFDHVSASPVTEGATLATVPSAQ